MSENQPDADTDDHVEYTDHFTTWCELDFGVGFLSPGGSEEVAKIVGGIDLTGKEVLDIGVGLAGPACLLVEEHNAERVIGIDVENPVLKRAAETVDAHGLQNRVVLKLVEPGPLPFADESFDFVFSKDAIIHIPDTEALFREIYRVLRPGGWIAISDWYCDDKPFTDEMTAWVKKLDLGLAMKPLDTDRARIVAAGFVDVEILDRNVWFQEYCKNLLQRYLGPQYATYVEVLGEKDAQDGIAASEERITITSQGQLRPGHIRGRKPA
jgi:phosphoethanolamine N-methyltransferase